MSTAEQRRWPRIKPRECYLRVLVEVPVRVREVSASGALLDAPSPVPAGSEAQLFTRLQGRPFAPEVHVRRTEDPAPGASHRQLAVTFESMDETAQTVLSEFLKKADGPAV